MNNQYNGQNPYSNNQQNMYSNNQSPNYNNGQNSYGANQQNTYQQPQGFYGQGYQSSSQPYANESYAQQISRIASEEVVSKSFLFMFFGLLFTAFAALTVSPEMIIGMMQSGAYFGVVIAELAVVILGGVAISKDKPILAAILYTVYCYLTGAIFSIFFLVYDLSSIITVFLVTSIIFGVMALYGMLTKKDLTKLSTFLLMGLLGIIIASLVNVFILHSSSIDLIITIVGIAVFMIYTAYDVRKIKDIAMEHPNRGVLCIALYGGFQLYLDFINLFIRLLRIVGKRK